jgi:hypothetical protein
VKAIDVDRAISVLNAQIASIEAQQAAFIYSPKKGSKRSPLEASRLTSQVMTMTRGLMAALDTIRKMGDDADEKVNALPPERIAALALRLVGKLSPEHRAAIALYIQELDGKLVSHGPYEDAGSRAARSFGGPVRCTHETGLGQCLRAEGHKGEHG